MREIKFDDIERVHVARETEGVMCKRCLYVWVPKVSTPKQCTNCKSPYWAFERSVKGDGINRNKYGFDEIKVGEWKEFKTAPPLPDGSINVEANSRFWRALEQYMRRKGYTYTWEGTASVFRVMRRT